MKIVSYLNLVIFLFMAVIAGQAKAQEPDTPTMRYMMCVESMMLAGAVEFVRTEKRKLHPNDLVTSAMSVCQKQKKAAITSVINTSKAQGGTRNFKEVNTIFNQRLVPEFQQSAIKINKGLRIP